MNKLKLPFFLLIFYCWSWGHETFARHYGPYAIVNSTRDQAEAHVHTSHFLLECCDSTEDWTHDLTCETKTTFKIVWPRYAGASPATLAWFVALVAYFRQCRELFCFIRNGFHVNVHRFTWLQRQNDATHVIHFFWHKIIIRCELFLLDTITCAHNWHGQWFWIYILQCHNLVRTPVVVKQNSHVLD